MRERPTRPSWVIIARVSSANSAALPASTRHAEGSVPMPAAPLQQRPLWRMAFSVFLPFAAAYYLSYVFRTINAVSAPGMSADIGIGAAELGLLTAVYFLTFAIAQLPIGVALDRFGPHRSRSFCCPSLFRGQSYLRPPTV